MAVFDEEDFLACCGSSRFAQEMILAGPFSNYNQALDFARDIWFNKVDVNGWLEAFAAHPQIGESSSQKNKSPTSAQWSKGEQLTALATATDSTLKELYDWNVRYREKFGFIFIICASGRSTPEILTELKNRYPNRPIVEFEIAAKEQMKITELCLAKLFSVEADTASRTKPENTTDIVTKAGGKERLEKMQAIKEKIHDMNEMRKVKAEVSKEEREERELAKARIEVAHEVRLAKEAEAAMDLHVHKAAEKAKKHEEKYPSRSDHQILANASNDSSFGPNSTVAGGGHSDRIFSDADGTTLSLEGSPGNTGNRGSSAAAATTAGITGNPANSTAGGPTITD